MNLKKRATFILTMIFLVSLVIQLAGSPSGTYEEFKYEQLMKAASEKGFIRLIVKLDVPDIEALTALSNSYQTGNTDDSFVQAAYDADLALEKAISQTSNSLLHQLNGYHYVVNRTFNTLPYIALSVPAKTLEKLSSCPEVLSIDEDKPYRLPISEKQPAADDISLPMLQRSVEVVGADIAWGFGYSGSGWYVAILDTGILRTHEMFQSKDIVEQCFSLGSDWYDRDNGGCPNGKIEMSGAGSAAPYEPRFGHGTHVAGIAAGNNYNDRFGVARDANIIAVQVFSYFPMEDDVLSWSSDQIKGLEYVYSLRNTYKISSVNMSLGGDRYYNFCSSDSRAAAINNLRSVGIATIVASGNDGYCDSVSSPACVPSAIAVNGTDKQDYEYMWGNWQNDMVDLLAPGDSITSADSTGNTAYRSRSGTSMATPHVTGAWAIMKQFDENMSIDDILTILQDTGKMITSLRCEAQQPEPRFNVGDALMTLLTLAPPANISAEQVSNRSLLRTEYINKLSWETNPLNQSKNVAYYKIYLIQNSQLISLGQVDSSTFTFLHRNVVRHESTTYGISAIDDQGQESLPAYYTLDF